jgi:hypothetical protein
MNAPNRIYIHPVAFPNPGLETRTDKNDIEYIHSDLIPRWVSVEDELPEKNGTYFCLRNGVGQCLGAWFIPLGSVEASYGGYFGDAEITHWLKGVPPIPKEE